MRRAQQQLYTSLVASCATFRCAARALLLLCALLTVTRSVLAQPAEPERPLLDKLSWAYASMNPMPTLDSQKKYTLSGSRGSFTQVEQQSFYDPADWYPEDHPAVPLIVAKGRESAGIWACAMCHYPNGQGRPENAGIAGLNEAYFVQQLMDFKKGSRHSSDTSKTNAALMAGFAAAMTPEEMEQSASYFSSMPWRFWVKVVETSMVPRTRVVGGVHLPLEGSDARTEPIGRRIIEMPQEVFGTETVRNPRVGWVAYVPPGAIARGEALVRGRKTTACTVCHGETLAGLAVVPALRGRSPSYIARQLGDLQSGARNGLWAPLMLPVVARLTADDILDISAYLASLQPLPRS